MSARDEEIGNTSPAGATAPRGILKTALGRAAVGAQRTAENCREGCRQGGEMLRRGVALAIHAIDFTYEGFEELYFMFRYRNWGRRSTHSFSVPRERRSGDYRRDDFAVLQTI